MRFVTAVLLAAFHMVTLFCGHLADLAIHFLSHFFIVESREQRKNGCVNLRGVIFFCSTLKWGSMVPMVIDCTGLQGFVFFG